MNNFDHFAQETSIRHQAIIKKICQPLVDHFDVNHFSYFKIKNSGEYSNFCSHPSWSEYYFSEKLYLVQPQFRHPSLIQSGISFPKKIPGSPGYQTAISVARNKYQINSCVIILDKTLDGFQGFAFDVKSSSGLNEMLVLNELPLLKKFFQILQKDNPFLFNAVDECSVNIGSLLGEVFYEPHIPASVRLANRHAFLKKIGFDIQFTPLTKRESEIMQGLLLNSSAKALAQELSLSSRTVENYIERLKDKFECPYKSDLARIARELELCGYFD